MPLHLEKSLTHSLGKRTVGSGAPYIVHQLHEHLGIGLAPEGVAMLLKHLLEYSIILDGAVMHECDIPALGYMGVCIDIVRLSVGGPAGMGNAY